MLAPTAGGGWLPPQGQWQLLLPLRLPSPLPLPPLPLLPSPLPLPPLPLLPSPPLPPRHRPILLLPQSTDGSKAPTSRLCSKCGQTSPERKRTSRLGWRQLRRPKRQ